MHALKKALEMRKGKGLDLTIMIGAPKHDGSAQMSDSIKEPMDEAEPSDGHGMKSMDEAMLMKKLDEAKSEDDSEDADQMDQLKHEIMGKMQDHEKESLMSRKPKSLMERAKMAAMGKK